MRLAAIPVAILTLLTVFALPGSSISTAERPSERVRLVRDVSVSPGFSLGITPRRYQPQEPRLVVKQAEPIVRPAEPPASQAPRRIKALPAAILPSTDSREPVAPPVNAESIASSKTCEAQPMSASAITLLTSLNQERLDRGIAGLETHPCGEHVAMLRARDLAERGYFAHVSPSGDSAASLMRSLEVTYSQIGENLARNNFPAGQSVDVAFQSLMDSDLHRAAILNASYRYVGVASTEDSSGMKYYVIIFLST